MKDLIISLVSKITDQPDKIVVNEILEKGGYFYEIRVADADIGKVIGRSGTVANAIRTLIKIIAMKQGKQAQIDVYSPKRLKKAGGY